MRIVVALLLSCSVLWPSISRGAILEWPVSAGGNGHFYTYIETPASWDEARELAAGMQHQGQFGYLATITSALENNFLIANFNQMGFLGGSDAAVEGEWRWVVGPEAGQLFFRGEYPDPNRQTLIYADWGSNEPNDFDNTPFGFPYPGEDYLNFSPENGIEWNDVAGAPFESRGFYVEFAVPEPASIILLGLASLGLVIARRRSG